MATLSIQLHEIFQSDFKLTGLTPDYEATLCPVCSAHTHEVSVVIPHGFSRRYCFDCEHWFAGNTLSDEKTFDYYNSSWNPEETKSHKSTGQTNLAVDSLLERYATSESVCLDVSAGTGLVANSLLKASVKEIHLTELSEARARLLGRDYQNVVETVSHAGLADLPALFKEKKFDFINLWHVLEHVQDCASAIKQLHSVCADDGIVCVSVPRFDQENWLESTLNHVHRHSFSVRSLVLLLEHNGFDVIERRTYLNSSGMTVVARKSKSVRCEPMDVPKLGLQSFTKKIISDLDLQHTSNVRHAVCWRSTDISYVVSGLPSFSIKKLTLSLKAKFWWSNTPFRKAIRYLLSLVVKNNVAYANFTINFHEPFNGLRHEETAIPPKIEVHSKKFFME